MMYLLGPRDVEKQFLWPSQKRSSSHSGKDGRSQRQLLIQPLLQDVLHGAVRRVAEGVGTGAGGVETARAVLLCQSEDAVNLAQVIPEVVLKQGLRRLPHLFTQLCCLLPAPVRRAAEEGRLFRRKVLPVGGAAPLGHAQMCLYQLVVQIGLDQLR